MLMSNANFLMKLEYELDAMARRVGHRYFDRIEINLGQLHEEDSSEHLAVRVAEEVIRQLELTSHEPETGVSRPVSPLAIAIDTVVNGRTDLALPLHIRTWYQFAEWLSAQQHENPGFMEGLFAALKQNEAFRIELLNLPFSVVLAPLADALRWNEHDQKIVVDVNDVLERGSIQLQQHLATYRKLVYEQIFRQKTYSPEFQDLVIALLRDAERLVSAENRDDLSELLQRLRVDVQDFHVLPHLEGPGVQVSLLPEVPGYWINNAGLVLVAPFLPTLFERTHIAVDGSIQHPGEALQMLAYLDLGEDGQYAVDLNLYKVLCGIEIRERIHLPYSLTQSLREACDEMLEALIGQWPVLKNTTPNGLREAFFHREGKLEYDLNGYCLSVENKAQDILLGHLPWGIGVIKLPWMPRPIYTDW